MSTSRRSDGRWRVRWRETIRDVDGTERAVQRERVVQDESTAIELRAKILRALETGAAPEPDYVRELEEVASLDSVLRGWLRSRRARGLEPSTVQGIHGSNLRALRALRAMKGIADDVPVPGSVLTREGVVELANQFRSDELSEGTIYATLRSLLRAWAWASDDPGAYPGIGSPPRDPASLLPRAPMYVASLAPTMAECDAVIRDVSRRARQTVALPVAIIARCTGLRVGQILQLRVVDVHLGKVPTITVSTGKSRREKADRRTVPFAPVLVEHLVQLVAGRAPEEGLVRSTRTKHPDGPNRSLHSAWEAATLRNEVRRETWNPSSRKIARPDHAFRAAFQAHLVSAGVRDEVIDALVGHAGGLRARHYVESGSRFEAMRDAVALIPPIDLGASPVALPDNVTRIR